MLEIMRGVSSIALLFAAAMCGACGERSALVDDGPDGASVCHVPSPTGPMPRFHRPCPESCPPVFPTSNPEPCAADGTCLSPYRCSGGFCALSGCLASTECDAGMVCTCAAANPSWGGNVCSPAQCQLDSDCGERGFCSPSPDSTCAAVPQRTWRCHTPNDTCIDDGDCDGGLCRFAPEVGAWMCAAATACGG